MNTSPPRPLTPLEFLTLIAVARLGEGAYAVPIREDIKAFAGRTVSVAAVYLALDRLDRLGLTKAWLSEPRPERGGRPRRHYQLTAAGRQIVRRERENARRMWRGVVLDN
jgi:DNA-binding PadR family transcriptional regulator